MTIKKFLDNFCDKLHGSGIDADWTTTETKKSHRLSNSFHLMNVDGFYITWIDFTIIFPKNSDNIKQDFKLLFHVNSFGRYCLNKHGLREYLETCICDTIMELS